MFLLSQYKMRTSYNFQRARNCTIANKKFCRARLFSTTGTVNRGGQRLRSPMQPPPLQRRLRRQWRAWLFALLPPCTLASLFPCALALFAALCTNSASNALLSVCYVRALASRVDVAGQPASTLTARRSSSSSKRARYSLSLPIALA